MRVTVFEAGGWGGIAHYTYNLCEALAQRGLDISLLTAQPYELASLQRSFRVCEGLSADAGYLSNLRATSSFLGDEKPDLIHVQSTLAARRDWLPLLILKALGQPWILTAHNVLPHDANERNSFGMASAYDVIYALSDHVIVHGASIKAELATRFRLPPERLTVIPHGDYAFVRPAQLPDMAEARHHLGIPKNSRVVLAFGVIREYKGLPDLIDAFAEVRTRIPNAHLLIAGKPQGVDPSSLRQQFRQLGLEGSCTLHTDYVPIADVPNYLQAADIAAFPYRAIAQSGALQLAYAFAKPVVATTVGALPETVADGENGILVPPGDPPALARALIGLLETPPDRLLDMGRRSAELADTGHRWDDAADRTLKLYTSILRPSASDSGEMAS